VSDSGTLRDQQAEFTKQLLIEAARKVILENDPEDFSMQKVAEAAGVSHRTVYRYFPSRQALIDEFSNWLETNIAGSITTDVLIEDLPTGIRALFERFDRYAEYYEAAARLGGVNLRPASQAERTRQVRAWFDEQFPDLDPYAADKAFAILRHLVGLQTWVTMRDRFGFEDGESGDAVSWAIEQMLIGLRDGRVPVKSIREESATVDSGAGDE
jgi:AcrR family transcriptional regulator